MYRLMYNGERLIYSGRRVKRVRDSVAREHSVSVLH